MSVAWYAAPDVNIAVEVVKLEFVGYEKKKDYKRQKLMGGEAGSEGHW